MTVTVKKAAEEKTPGDDTKPEDETKPGDDTKPEDKKPQGFTIYFANNKKWTEVNATFFNRETGEKSEPVKMQFAEQNSKGEDVYCTAADIDKYDRVVFDNGTDKTTDTPVNKASSGFYIASNAAQFNGKFLAGVYTHGEQGAGKIESVELDYHDGYEKTVKIWTPDGYDPEDTEKKYSVLYMSDGQSLFGTEGVRSAREWCCDETVRTLMNNGGDGIIIVGIVTNDENRFNELTPAIGKLSPEMPDLEAIGGANASLSGEKFSDFLVNDVIPYVEKNYNTNSVRGFAGSSNGGLEAFYIGMEHPGLFSYIGVISPAMDFFASETWDEYLSKKDFSGDTARVYIYCGNQDFIEKLQHDATAEIEGKMKKAGYPADKVVTVLDNDGAHNEGFWAIYFTEMLKFGLQF